MKTQRGFAFLFVLLATMAAATPATWMPDFWTPAFGQTPTPAAVPQAASVPDFSGVWGHPYLFPGFEQPLSGPGPLLNKYRRKQLFDADGRPLPATPVIFAGDNNKLVADYANPMLKPDAAEAVRKHGEIELGGAAAPNPSNQCWPEPVPYILWNFGIQLLQQPDKLTILYNEDHEFRQVRMNEPHPAQVTPSWYGDSVGRYEGDTLVIDTVGIKVDRPFAMVDMFGTPYTKALHVVERYRLLDREAARAAQERAGKELFRLPGGEWTHDPNYDGKGLQLTFTVEDDGVFTTPWSATVTYRRAAQGWPEIVCAENRYEYYAATDTAVPRADKPDF
jgi:hypothetical protein